MKKPTRCFQSHDLHPTQAGRPDALPRRHQDPRQALQRHGDHNTDEGQAVALERVWAHISRWLAVCGNSKGKHTMNTRIAPWKRKPAKPSAVVLVIPEKGQLQDRITLGREIFCAAFPELRNFPIKRLHGLFTKGVNLGLYKKWTLGAIVTRNDHRIIPVNLEY